MVMSNPQDFTPQQEAKVVINYKEPPTKPPPLLEVGALAWLRKNLFGSPLDVLLTFIGFFISVVTVVTLVQWTVQSADWMAIHLNVQRFLVDRIATDNLWRVINAALFIALTSGITVAAYYRRLSPLTIATSAVIFLPIFFLPILINALIPMPHSYMAAGGTVTLGVAQETPAERIAYIGVPGQTVTVRLAQTVDDMTGLSQIDGFMDRTSNTLRNAALTEINNNARFEVLTAMIVEDSLRWAAEIGTPAGSYGTLTPDQRTRLYAEYDALIGSGNPESQERLEEIAEIFRTPPTLARLSQADREALIEESLTLRPNVPVVDVYTLNQAGVVVRLLDAELRPITDALTLNTLDDVLSYTHPEGEATWYVLEKRVEGADEGAVALLEVNNMMPVFRTGETYRPLPDERPVIRDALPRDEDGVDLPFVSLIQNKYRGERSFSNYLRIYVSPFLEKVTPGAFQMILAFLAGFAMARIADWQFSPREKWNKQSRRMSTWAIILTPIVFFLYVNGIGVDMLGLGFTDARRWGGLLLAVFITFYGIIIAFPLGVGLALGRRSELPAVRYLCTVIIETVRGTPFIVVLFAGQLFIPLLHPSFAEIPNSYRALGSTIIFVAAYLAENVRGGLQSIPPGQEEAARALGLSNWQITYFITLPQALRAVIPALVGQFISLFKDTSLLAIVGLIDLTGVVNTMVAQAEFNDARREGLLVISITYFVISYVMSYVSRRIEESGSGSARRV